MNLRIGFEAPGDNAFSRLIAGYDAPKRFSHVAFIFGDNLRLDAHIDYGVRFHNDIPDGDRWTFIDPGLLPGEVETVRQFCEVESGCGYDKCGVLAVAHVPFAHEDKEKWFCSEIVAAGLKTVEMLDGYTPHLLSPNGLYLALTGEAA